MQYKHTHTHCHVLISMVASHGANACACTRAVQYMSHFYTLTLVPTYVPTVHPWHRRLIAVRGICKHSPKMTSIHSQQFQELEEQRIAFLRHQMWTFCNLCSQTTVDIDEVGTN